WQLHQSMRGRACSVNPLWTPLYERSPRSTAARRRNNDISNLPAANKMAALGSSSIAIATTKVSRGEFDCDERYRSCRGRRFGLRWSTVGGRLRQKVRDDWL